MSRHSSFLVSSLPVSRDAIPVGAAGRGQPGVESDPEGA